jgi:cysteine desulfurase
MIYADYNGSAPLLDEVKKYLIKRFESSLFANPNAIHSLGGKLLSGIEKSRDLIAQVLGCYPDQIIFNSGSSEGVSTIFHSLTNDKNSAKKIIISSPIEHAIVNLNLEDAKSRGFQIIFLETNIDGSISLNHLESLLKEKSHEVAFVTVMASNNETGVIQPYLEISKICRQFKTPYFSDTTQFIGKEEFHFLNSGMDYAVCSGHKLGALTGSGFIIAKDPTHIKPLIFSKYHEKGLRGGTQHYLGIETMAIALNDFNKNKASLKTLKEARLKFETEIKNEFPQVVIIGDKSERLAGTTLIAYPGIHGQAVQIELESNDIFVTTSAACSDNQPETSDALKALKVDDTIGRGVIRISLGLHQGEEEYSQIARNLKNAYNKLRKIQSY